MGEDARSALLYSGLRFFRKATPTAGGWDSVIDVATRQLAGRFGFRTLVEGEIFCSCRDRTRALPSLLNNGYRCWGGALNTYLI